jgi:hypothetical protein
MATIQLPPDFKEFLRLLNSRQVEYLLVDGYAVSYHGYPRATGDMDVWIARDRQNAESVVAALREFGFDSPELSVEVFLQAERVIRMGLPPFRIEVLTTISGVNFAECYAARIVDVIDGVEVNLINLHHLKINKQASGRLKDLNDVANLP